MFLSDVISHAATERNIKTPSTINKTNVMSSTLTKPTKSPESLSYKSSIKDNQPDDEDFVIKYPARKRKAYAI